MRLPVFLDPNSYLVNPILKLGTYDERKSAAMLQPIFVSPLEESPGLLRL
jgi:hypothetical protein